MPEPGSADGRRRERHQTGASARRSAEGGPRSERSGLRRGATTQPPRPDGGAQQAENRRIQAGAWRPSPDLAQYGDDVRTAVVDLNNPGRPPVILEGTAAVIWQALVTGPPTEVIEACRARGVDEQIAGDFLEQLHDAGIAERC